MNDTYSEALWQLPDDKMYTVQIKGPHDPRWEGTNEFDTKRNMKQRAIGMPEHKTARVIRISKYPPHGIVEVVFYREGKV